MGIRAMRSPKGGRIFGGTVKKLVKTLASHIRIECLVPSSSSRLWLPATPDPGRQLWSLKQLGSCHSCGRPELGSYLPASALIHPSLFWASGEWIRGWEISVWLSNFQKSPGSSHVQPRLSITEIIGERFKEWDLEKFTSDCQNQTKQQ